MWKEVVKKAGDAEAKANLQSPFYVGEINSRYSKDYRPSAKKNKEDIYQESQNEASKDKDKTKSHSSSTSANQSQTQIPKKNKRGRRGGHGGHPVTGVNAIKVAKKDKAPKDLSYIEYYTCHQKDHYATKYPDKPKS